MLDNCFKFTRRILKYTIAYGSFFCIFLSYWRCVRNISRSRGDPVLQKGWNLSEFLRCLRLAKDIAEVVAFEIPWNSPWRKSRCLVHEKTMDRSSWWFQPSCNTELFVKVDQSAIEENLMKFVWTTVTHCENCLTTCCFGHKMQIKSIVWIYVEHSKYIQIQPETILQPMLKKERLHTDWWPTNPMTTNSPLPTDVAQVHAM